MLQIDDLQVKLGDKEIRLLYSEAPKPCELLQIYGGLL